MREAWFALKSSREGWCDMEKEEKPEQCVHARVISTMCSLCVAAGERYAADQWLQAMLQWCALSECEHRINSLRN